MTVSIVSNASSVVPSKTNLKVAFKFISDPNLTGPVVFNMFVLAADGLICVDPAVIVPDAVTLSFIVTVPLSLEEIVFPETSIVPSLCVPVPFALRFPGIVTSLGNENVTVSVAETVAVT